MVGFMIHFLRSHDISHCVHTCIRTYMHTNIYACKFIYLHECIVSVHIAAAKNQTDILRLLADRGCDLNVRHLYTGYWLLLYTSLSMFIIYIFFMQILDGTGYTALMRAAAKGLTDTVMTLLELGSLTRYCFYCVLEIF